MSIKPWLLLWIAVLLCACSVKRPATTHGPGLRDARELNRQQNDSIQDAKDSVRGARRTNDEIEQKLIRLERGDYER